MGSRVQAWGLGQPQCTTHRNQQVIRVGKGVDFDKFNFKYVEFKTTAKELQMEMFLKQLEIPESNLGQLRT